MKRPINKQHVLLLIGLFLSVVGYALQGKKVKSDSGAINSGIYPDTSINEMKIEDAKYFYDKHYDLIYNKPYGIGLGSDRMVLLNAGKSERVTLIRYPGGLDFRFGKIMLDYNEAANRDSNEIITPEKEFVTSSNLKLGSTLQALNKAIKKMNIRPFVTYQRENQSNKIVAVKISSEADSCFLNRYNMPEYEASYELKNDVIVKITFGFSDP